MNAGQIAAVKINTQKLANIQDSTELMMGDMLKVGGELNHPNLLRIMITESNNVIQWIQEEFGINYRNRATQLGGHSAPGTLR